MNNITTTTINNNERIFLLTGDMGKHLICNIEDFKKCFNQFEDKDEVQINHLWNNRFVKCSKKSVIDMSEALNLEHPFNKYYFVSVKFNGRKIGADGKLYNIKASLKVKNTRNLAELYEQFEHVTQLKVISLK